MHVTRRWIYLVVALGLLGWLPPQWARADQVADGQRIAAGLCARCHVIAPTGAGSWTDAPPFEAIANRPGMTRDWLANFVQQPHMHMLTDDYTRPQADSIAAYIMSLRAK